MPRHHPYSRSFAKKVKAVLDEEEPNVIRIENYPLNSVAAGDYVNGSASRQQDIFDIFRITSHDYTRQFTTYYDTVIGSVGGSSVLNFNKLTIITTLCSLANVDAYVDFWLVTPRDAVPETGAYVFTNALSTIITEGFTNANMGKLTGDVIMSITNPGVLPYDSQLFCQQYKLGKMRSMKLSPGQAITLTHSKYFGTDATPLSTFFDSTAGLYNFVDAPPWSLGLICRVRGEIGKGTTDATPGYGYMPTELSWHNTLRWDYSPAHTSTTAFVRGQPEVSAAPFTSALQIIGPGVSAAVTAAAL